MAEEFVLSKATKIIIYEDYFSFYYDDQKEACYYKDLFKVLYFKPEESFWSIIFESLMFWSPRELFYYRIMLYHKNKPFSKHIIREKFDVSTLAKAVELINNKINFVEANAMLA